MAEVRDRDIHATPTPRWGGLAMYGGFLAGLLIASQAARGWRVVFETATDSRWHWWSARR